MRAVSLKNLVQKLSGLGLENLFAKYKSAQDIGSLCNALLQLKGEASSVALAQEILNQYRDLSPDEKLEFFHYLVNDLGVDTGEVDAAVKRYQTDKSQTSIQALHQASESRRLDLFRALNMASEGTHSLIAMREDIFDIQREHPVMRVVSDDLLHLFRSWFNRGFLDIRRIDWHTPAEVLEKLIEYESVHEIKGWDDLRRRLEEDRRCFGFFHPVMPVEPLIFVEVALTNGISTNITELLHQKPNHNNGHEFDTAIFYSINNCLEGLRGVSFGNLLIKQVVDKLEREFSSINTYSTLSPIPNFMGWLDGSLSELDFLALPEKESIRRFLAKPMPTELADDGLKPLLLKCCAWYLLIEKSRDKPACPVARFHLGNGATLAKINWSADLSDNGMKQSAGLMVNYIYDKATLARNHEAYESENTIAASGEVRKLLPMKEKKARPVNA